MKQGAIKLTITFLVLLNVLQASVLVAAHLGLVEMLRTGCRMRVFGTTVELPYRYVLRSDFSEAAHFGTGPDESAGGITSGQISSFVEIDESTWALEKEFEKNGLTVKRYYHEPSRTPLPLIFVSDGKEYATILDQDETVWQFIVGAAGRRRE